MKFIASFGKSNTFGLDIVPVTNKSAIEDGWIKSADASDNDWEKYANDPDGINYPLSLRRAQTMCVGGTVAFA